MRPGRGSRNHLRNRFQPLDDRICRQTHFDQYRAWEVQGVVGRNPIGRERLHQIRGNRKNSGSHHRYRLPLARRRSPGPNFLEVAKFPEITFVNNRIEKQAENYFLLGVLTMHGVAKEVRIPFTYSGKATDQAGVTRIGMGLGRD